MDRSTPKESNSFGRGGNSVQFMLSLPVNGIYGAIVE